jgi:hypothetical protein
MYTVSGQLVYEKINPKTIQVSDLQRGLYIVQIHTLNNEVLTRKLVVRYLSKMSLSSLANRNPPL